MLAHYIDNILQMYQATSLIVDMVIFSFKNVNKCARTTEKENRDDVKGFLVLRFS